MKIMKLAMLLLLNTCFFAQNKPNVSSGTIQRLENFKSKYVDARNIDVWLPDGYSNKEKYAVLYMHDGQMLYDAASTWNKTAWEVDEVAGKLISENKTTKFIVIGVWNNDKKRHPEYFPQKPFESLTKEQKSKITAELQAKGRTTETFQPISDHYLKFLVTELKPFIDKNFSTKSDQQNTFVAGSSMGGLISMYAICEYPKIFGGAACLSTHWPGTFKVDKNPIPEAFADYLKQHLPKPKNHKIYFDYGDQTLDAMYPALQQKVDLILKSKGYNATNWITKFYPGDDHSEKSWSKRLHLPLLFLLSNQAAKLTMQTEKLKPLPFGSIKPKGWLKQQMQKDIDGFVGNLDQLVPDLINDPIYGSGRLHKNSQAKDLGNLKAGDAEGSEQYKWWNSETQSNWWDAYIRNVFLLDDKDGIEKANHYIQHILTTQDDDGYIGIYDKNLRYNFNSENGELWSKTTLYRGLLAYYETTKDQKVWGSLVQAVDNVMRNYPINTSSPFSSGEKFNGGVSHGLTFTDVLDKMYQITNDKKYVEYAFFLYEDFSKTYQSECDVQLQNILNPDYKLKSHGVHTYEHLRPLLVAAYQKPELQKALAIYLERLSNAITITGGPIGDEWIAEKKADPSHTGYEYCSIHELTDSYIDVMQKTGSAAYGDKIENTFFNAAQGSRNPTHSCIAYLKTDNSYEMLGTKNGEIEPDRKQTRYKYSPAHQDIAVCCNPNAGRISPYFIQSSWMKENENTLVAALLCPNVLETTIDSHRIKIETITDYPYQNKFDYKIANPENAALIIKIRKPSWATVITNEAFFIEDDFIVINRKFKSSDTITLEFSTKIIIKTDENKENYFTYGALVYAKPIEATEEIGRVYKPGFEDIMYKPLNSNRYEFIKDSDAFFKNGKITSKLKNSDTNKIEEIELLPIGRTILRQVSF